MGRSDPGWVALPETGRYELTIHARAGSGAYDLWVRDSETQRFEIQDGQTIAADQPDGAGRIENAGDVDSYRFNGRQGDRITVAIDHCSITGRHLKSELRTRDRAGADIALATSPACEDGGHAELIYVLPADGTYRILVHGSNTATIGTYHARITMR